MPPPVVPVDRDHKARRYIIGTTQLETIVKPPKLVDDSDVVKLVYKSGDAIKEKPLSKIDRYLLSIGKTITLDGESVKLTDSPSGAKVLTVDGETFTDPWLTNLDPKDFDFYNEKGLGPIPTKLETNQFCVKPTQGTNNSFTVTYKAGDTSTELKLSKAEFNELLSTGVITSNKQNPMVRTLELNIDENTQEATLVIGGKKYKLPKIYNKTTRPTDDIMEQPRTNELANKFYLHTPDGLHAELGFWENPPNTQPGDPNRITKTTRQLTYDEITNLTTYQKTITLKRATHPTEGTDSTNAVTSKPYTVAYNPVAKTITVTQNGQHQTFTPYQTDRETNDIEERHEAARAAIDESEKEVERQKLINTTDYIHEVTDSYI